MKKKYVLPSVLLSVAVFLTACTQGGASEDVSSSTGSTSQSAQPLNIVCTTFPVYDWTMEVLGEHADEVNVTLLYDNGVDVHSFQPSVDDILAISQSDVFFYIGGESELWVEDALAESGENGPLSVNLMDTMGDRLLEDGLLEGMQDHDHDHGEATDDHDHDHSEATDDHDHSHEGVMDEHIWLSLENAEFLTEAIATTLSEVDAENASTYSGNAAAYIELLDGLDDEYSAMVDAAARNTVLFADRFPFRYLCNDYDIEVYAAFPGCSAETEASFETVASLSDSLSENAMPYILLVDDSGDDLAQTLMQNTGLTCEILRLNSMQNVSDDFMTNDVTYLSVMRDNLDVLSTAMN